MRAGPLCMPYGKSTRDERQRWNDVPAIGGKRTAKKAKRQSGEQHMMLQLDLRPLEEAAKREEADDDDDDDGEEEEQKTLFFLFAL